jgi:hypothetical protein
MADKHPSDAATLPQKPSCPHCKPADEDVQLSILVTSFTLGMYCENCKINFSVVEERNLEFLKAVARIIGMRLRHEPEIVNMAVSLVSPVFPRFL